MNKNSRVQIMFESEKVEELVDKAATIECLDRSAFCRRAILKEAKKILEEYNGLS